MKILKFNESLSISEEKISDEDISYIYQIFDDAIELCEIRTELNAPWRNSDGKIFFAAETCNIELDDNKLFIENSTSEYDLIHNGAILYFIYDKHDVIQCDVNERYSKKVYSNTELLDLIEDVSIGIKRINQDKNWGSYYTIYDQTIEVYLYKC